jgi:hypothetical protein
MATRKTSTEKPERKATEVARHAENERQSSKPEPLDEKSLDEVMRECPL